jgi:hypothetical protein
MRYHFFSMTYAPSLLPKEFWGGNVLVTNGTKNRIQLSHCFSQKRRTKVPVTRGHPEVFVAQKSSDDVNVGAAHSEPRSGGVS